MKTMADDAGDTNPRAPGLTLARALKIFVRQPTARLLALAVTTAVTLRMVVGGLSLWDLALLAGIIAVHPMTEWCIHVFLLHWRPRKVGPLRVDFLVSRDHRRHHEDPYDPRYWYIPLPSGAIGLVIVVGVSLAVLPTTGLALTAIGTILLLGLVYEWTHYLCHTSYRPRSSTYRRIWRHHRLHHFKNEHYWMGVTMHAGDRLLRTLPDAKQVETSPTCRQLLLD
jgi:hypothetical protein